MKKKYIAFAAGLVVIAIIVVFCNIFLIKSVDVVFVNKPRFADEDSIINASQISLNTNIFNLNDDQIKENINSYYGNNSIAILNIERVFPNKVKIHIKERQPILIASYAEENGKECIPTDINFQMVERKPFSSIDYPAIFIKGVYVDTTFNTNAFRQINRILTAFEDMNFTQDGLVAFIKEIVVSEKSISLILRHGDGVFELDRGQHKDIYDRLIEAYSSFLKLDYANRNICLIKA